MSNIEFIETGFSGLKLVKSKRFYDNRGFFTEGYVKSKFAQDISNDFIQDNISVSKKNVIRGMHGQTSPCQAKFVQCLSGEILDVVVDVRPESSTYKQIFSVLLSTDSEHSALFVPAGFLHGFISKKENSVVHYKVDGVYSKDGEFAVSPFGIDFDWGIKQNEAILSDKDIANPTLDELLRSSKFINDISVNFNGK